MKTNTLVSVFALAGSLTAVAQGVHLNAGDWIAIGFDSVGGCSFTELAPPSNVGVAFGNDSLGVGDSLRLEMFENSLNELPFAVSEYSSATPLTFVQLGGPIAWRDFQGLVRVSMLSGAVDVRYAHFIVGLNANTICSATVFAVPEPSTFWLAGLGFTVGGGIFAYKRIYAVRHLRKV